MTSTNTTAAPLEFDQRVADNVNEILAEHEMLTPTDNGGWLCDCGAYRVVASFAGVDEMLPEESVDDHRAHVAETIAAAVAKAVA